MARRSSGWTIVKGIAREVDRANRQAQRNAIAREKAYLREEQRTQRELEKLHKKLDRLQNKFNSALSAANDSTNISVKERKLSETRQVLHEIQSLELEYPGVSINNLWEFEASISEAQGGLDELKAVENQKLSMADTALQNTEKAQRLRDDIDNVLKFTLNIDDALDWEDLKDNQPFLIPRPSKPAKPTLPAKPTSRDLPRRPNSQEYAPHIPLYAHLVASKKRALREEADQKYQAALAKWKTDVANIEEQNQANLKEWERKKDALIGAWESEYQKKLLAWKKRQREHKDAQSQYNGGLQQLKSQYEAHEREAVEEYCRLVLARSEYPFSFSKDYQLEYDPEAKLLALDYQLPTIDVVPDLKEEKFIRTRSEIKRTAIPEKQRKDIYEKLLYAMVIRTIHELFEADTVDAIAAIAMNGWVTSLDKATGHDTTRCIVTISVEKDTFLQINLANVDEKACFKNLKGIGSAKLSELVPVAPVVSLNREDQRFIDGYEVMDHVDEGENLALMNWGDFEHLIRELFEKEFCSDGSEVRVTQASRDGGVDAVIFDPDPIRGGKIVVQAKRYTNTVGVSAVRDLYGTVQHEGAMKGILITTSNYGGDAHDFAKGKPITLMNGENLIYLLERHGRKARIDLAEAKKLLQS